MAKDPADEIKEDLDEFLLECRTLIQGKDDKLRELEKEHTEERVDLAERLSKLETKMGVVWVGLGVIAVGLIGIALQVIFKQAR